MDKIEFLNILEEFKNEVNSLDNISRCESSVKIDRSTYKCQMIAHHDGMHVWHGITYEVSWKYDS